MSNDIAGNDANARTLVGDLLADRYRVEAVIGRGGMATVYRATDEALGRTVAIKVFRTELADADDVRRQQEEIRLIAGLSHFALVTLFDAVADDSSGEHGRAFIVMQFVDGDDLRDRLARGPLDPRTTAMVGADLAEALAYVHHRGVVHRDVKPANILLPRREQEATGPQAMLADFGIARIVDGTRLTATGSVIGTANYLSPEQAVGGAASGATDIYSLGLVLIECLTGEKVFPGSALESVSARLGSDPVIPDRFGAEWAAVLRAMTVREPSSRIGASEAAAALRLIALADSEPPELTELLEPTRRYPVIAGPDSAATEVAAGSEPAATELMATEVLSAAGRAVQPKLREAPRTTPRRKRPRLARIVFGAAIAAVLLAGAIGIGVWIVSSQAPSPHATQTKIVYPEIPGDLGTHLKQLEKAVAP
jgi:serine/threonine protein kinase